ncbi:MAG: ABC transporter substrate-binding protein [Candidatus Nanopelagicales bacterium]
MAATIESTARRTLRPATPTRTRLGRAMVVAALSMGLAACSAGTTTEETASQATGSKLTTVRVGFFPNITHAPALIGMQEGLFKKSFKELGLTVTPTVFNAGPDAVTALFGESLDIAYIGPNPTINAYTESGGEAIKVIAGAASGGAALVVRSDIKAADLKGKKLASPQLGNTQDVALRHWLKDQGLNSTTEGGGDVAIVPQANAEGVAAFSAGQIDGAWVPQPWVAEYQKVGAKILVDEASLWPDGKFVTANVVVRSKFLQEHPDAVAAFLDAHVAALQEIAADPAAAAIAANENLKALTGSSLDPKVVTAAFKDVEFTADPLPATLKKSADNAIAVGLLDSAKVETAGGLPGDLYDLGPINAALERAGQPEVKS